MTLRHLGIAALALLGGVRADTCCFVVQDEAHEVYWSETKTQTYTAAVNSTIVTALVTPFPKSTVTNYKTNYLLTKKVFTREWLVTENPVALYSNPANAIAQKTQILDGPEPAVTGGVTVQSPTGFWVYSTAKIYTAEAVTDSDGNVACGTVSSFTTDAPACVPTFVGVNSNAAAYYDGGEAQAIISLTTPYIHVPTRATLPKVGDDLVCAQGNGTQNYGYPAQDLIAHLAADPVYRAQYPGIVDCIPAGPSIQALRALAVVDTLTSAKDATSILGAILATTETPSGGLSTTTIITNGTTGPTGGVSTTTTTSVSTPATPDSTTTPPALPVESSTTSSPSIETPSGTDLLPDTSTSTSTSVSTTAPTPLPEVSSSTPTSTSSSIVTALPMSQIQANTTFSTSSTPPSTSSSTSTPLPIVANTSIATTEPSTSSSSTSVAVSLTTPESSILAPVTSATAPNSTVPISTPTSSPTPIQVSTASKYAPWEILAWFMALVALALL